MEITRTKKITNSKDNILELILKEIREIKKDVTILKKDVADIKRCPTIAKELAELRLKK